MTTEEWFDKAIAYFNGTMSIDQSRLFEKETAEREELSTLMQLWKNIDEEAPLYEQYREDAENLVKTHQRIKAEFINEKEIIKGKVKSTAWRWVAIAAAITGIIFVMKIFTPSSHDDSPVAEHKVNNVTAKKDSASDTTRKGIEVQMLYAQNFAPDEVPLDPNGPLDDAFFYYASAQYAEAIMAIDSSKNKTLTRGSGSVTPLTKFYEVYYKALSLLSLGREGEAVPHFITAVSLAPSASLKTKAQWYLSLAYLKQENISASRYILQALLKSNPKGLYRSKAEKLLSSLNK